MVTYGWFLFRSDKSSTPRNYNVGVRCMFSLTANTYKKICLLHLWYSVDIRYNQYCEQSRENQSFCKPALNYLQCVSKPEDFKFDLKLGTFFYELYKTCRYIVAQLGACISLASAVSVKKHGMTKKTVRQTLDIRSHYRKTSHPTPIHV